MSIVALPTEVLQAIFRHVPAHDIWKNIRSVCTHWKAIVDADKGGWILKAEQNAIKVPIYYQKPGNEMFGTFTTLRFGGLANGQAYFTDECMVAGKVLYYMALPLINGWLEMDDFFTNPIPFPFNGFQLHVESLDSNHYILTFVYPLSTLAKIAATPHRLCQYSKIDKTFVLERDSSERAFFFSEAKKITGSD